MAAEELGWMAARLRLGYWGRGSRLVGPESGPADRLFIIKQGAVRGSPSARARTGVDAVLGPGECFPISALIGRRPTAFDYRAEADTFAYELATEDFHALLERSAQFRRFCTETVAALLGQSHRTLRAELAEHVAEEGRLASPLRTLVARAPVSCPPQTPIREVLKRMQEDRIGAMVVVDGAGRPAGIFTQPDALERVALAGRSLDEPISAVMTPDPIVTAAEATAADGALVMARYGIRHLVLVEAGRLLGVVSERDLFAFQRSSVRRSAQAIRSAASAEALAGAAGEVRELTRALMAQGMGAEQLTLVVTALNDAIVQRALELATGRHAPGGRWCWIGLGSEGRMEQTFASDQDNALILGEGAQAERFLPFADEVNRTLDACGFELCRGDIMARNPRWCLPLEAWRSLFLGWIRNPDPQALLGAAIFFDLRALGGDAALAGELTAWLLDRAAASPMFLRAMATNALETRPPLGLLSHFVTQGSQVDLKMLGARPFTDAARVWALARRSGATSTTERLRAAGLPDEECEASVAAFHFIQSLRLRHGRNLLNPETLNVLDRRILKEAFREAVKVQQRLRMDYGL